jgi:hypothetical protein
MATRYSGNATIRVSLDDMAITLTRAGYKATVSVDGRNVWSGTIREPLWRLRRGRGV